MTKTPNQAHPSRRLLLGGLLTGLCLAQAQAQSIEPRAYANAPVGINFLVAGYAKSQGGLAFDPASPIKNPHLDLNSAIFAYARTLDLGGLSGKVDIVLPYTALKGKAEAAGQPLERLIDGIGDPALRLSVNFLGAPALSLKDFRAYQQDLIVGASLQVSAPWGQYDPSRLVNLSSHRWTVKPEVGLSQALGEWTLEGKAAVTLFGDNNDFYGGSTRAQDPLYSAQAHLVYAFTGNRWASLDATCYAGGRTTLNGTLNNDLQQNWRFGATLALPVDARNSIKLYASSGVSARTGNSFDLLGLFWQYRWGGGL